MMLSRLFDQNMIEHARWVFDPWGFRHISMAHDNSANNIANLNLFPTIYRETLRTMSQLRWIIIQKLSRRLRTRRSKVVTKYQLFAGLNRRNIFKKEERKHLLGTNNRLFSVSVGLKQESFKSCRLEIVQ